MANAQLVLGGIFDFATADEVNKAVNNGVDRILGHLPSKDRGIRKRIPDSVSPNAAGTFVLDFGSPPPDTIWWIQEVAVTGGDDRTALGGTTTPATTVTPAPAAGAESITVVPAGQTWTLQSWMATLTTAATVANRTVNLIIDDGAGHTIWQDVANATQAATLVVTYQGTAGVARSAAVVGGILQLDFPQSLQIPSGYRIRTLTTNIQAGDQWSAANVNYLTTTPAVQAAMYLGPPPDQHITTINNAPLLGNLIRPAISVPGVFPFSGEAFPVHTGEELFIIVYTGATSVLNLSGVATVVELPASSVLLNTLR